MSHADERLSAARAAIAAACLDALPDATLGEVTLRSDQRRIVARARRAMERVGGCLIAEDVGRGKTFVALALARRWQRPLVIAPASLRSLWNDAAQRAHVVCAIASHESLSRGRVPDMPFDGIIVDESHHYRNPGTTRYAVLAGLAAHAPLVLLSATPLQNKARDLAAQIALFLGEQAFAFAMPALSRFVIRGPEPADGVMPIVAAPKWIDTGVDDSRVLEAILDLPPPARVLDGGDAGALRAINLVRAWASSRAALVATLRSRRRTAAAIEQGVDAGRAPTRREARAWHGAEDVVQLGFASVLMNGSPSDSALAQLRSALDGDREAMNRLISTMRDAEDPDPARIAALRQLRGTHSSSRIIAFSEYASTITSFFSALRGDAGVGMLTAREARIASGRITRDEMLARFAPVAQNAKVVGAHEAVTLLLATDLLSEGANLQDANVVVHLDLPWNPARLAQRVGRVRRPGGAGEVQAYLLSPPARAEKRLDAERRLRRKLATAKTVVGRSFDLLPALARESALSLAVAPSPGDAASAEAEGALTARLDRWQSVLRTSERDDSPCIVAAVESDARAWFAALDDGRVVGSLDGRISDSASWAVRVADLLERPSRIPSGENTRTAFASLHRWLAAEHLANTCGLDAPTGPCRRAVLDGLDALARALPRHERASALPLAARIRDALRAPLPLGAERLLADIATQCWIDGKDVSRGLASALRVIAESSRGVRPAQPHEARVAALVIAGHP